MTLSIKSITHKTNTKTIFELCNLFDGNHINLSPGFQRQSVWVEKERAKLIDSILRNYPLPAIFLYKREDNGKPVYDELLERSLAKKKNVHAAIKYRRTIVELVIESGSLMDGKCVKNIQWPTYSLAVNLKRGEREIIPTGDTRLQSGDYLYILVNDQEIRELTQLANK